MLTLPPRVRVFVSMAPFDMRGGAHRMAGTARRLGLEPLDGHFYVFVSRRRNLLAVLHFDGSGWCVLKKRLDGIRSIDPG